MSGALERGESSRSACSARSSRSPLAPLSLASLAGASGWRLVVLLSRVVTFLLVAPSAPLRSHSSLALRAGGRRCRPARGSSLLRGRSPSLPSHLSLLSAPGAASLAAARLRSLPAPPLRASARGRAFFSGGAAAWLVAAALLVAALAWRALCCCASSSSFVPGSAALSPPSPRRRRRSASRRRRGCPAPRCSAPPLRSVGRSFPPLRSGHPLAARRSFGGRALSPAAVVCRRSRRSLLRAVERSLHARSGCSARGGLRMRQSRAQIRWFLGAVAPSPPFSTHSRRRKKSTEKSCKGRPKMV